MRGLSARIAANVLFLVLFSVAVIAGAFLSFVSGVLFDDSYRVSVTLPEAGGVLPEQEVTVLGRAVGQVEDVELSPEGVELTLKIDGDQSVPATSRVRVLRRSPIGEQAVELAPVTPTWEPAADDAALTVIDPQTPAQVPFLLERTVKLFDAVDKDALSTVLHELAVALDGRGEQLKQLNREVTDLNETFIGGIPTYQRLIDSSTPVLQTLKDHTADLRELFDSGADLAEVLASNRPTVDRLLDVAPGTLGQAEALVINTRANLQCIMEDVDDINDMLLGPTTATTAAVQANYGSKMDEVLSLLDNHTMFFQLGFGIVLQHDPRTGVKWARIQLSTQEATGAVYPDLRPTPPTLPGAACQADVWGTGVNAVRQSDAQPPDETSPGILYAPLVEEVGPGTVEPPPVPDDEPGSPMPATGGGFALVALAAVSAATTLRRRP